MTSSVSLETLRTLDAAYIAEIVRRVHARLKEAESSSHEKSKAAAVPQASPVKLVTVAMVVEAAKSATKSIPVNRKTVITPAARDEARRAGVSLAHYTTHSASTLATDAAAPTRERLGVLDTTSASWAESIVSQLARRGIRAGAGDGCCKVVLTDRPAAETHRYSVNEKMRAVMIHHVHHVARFHEELRPQVWVIDKAEVNLVTAVNIAAQVARLAEAAA